MLIEHTYPHLATLIIFFHPQICVVPCLLGMAEIQQECEKLHLKLSNDTRKFLIFEMLKSLGPSQSQRLISKCK